MKQNGLSRRKLIFAGLAGAGALWALKPSDKGANHSDYFTDLSRALSDAGQGTPRLLVDKAKLNQNIATLQKHINNRFHYRIVAKSLPSIGLIAHVMRETGSNRLMVFHQPFLSEVARQLPHSDVLLGKPMPVAAARTFYEMHADRRSEFDPAQQLQWLIDSPERLQQYQLLAEERQQAMRIAIEIDVGLHRGGVVDNVTLATLVKRIEAHPLLSLGGLMGYEPQVAKLPGSASHWRAQAMRRYSESVDLLRELLGESAVKELILNCGGSPTYQLYDEGDFPFNELSAGSCLVKPTDFDIASLNDHLPAAYIATPVLKTAQQTHIPGIDLGQLQALWDPNKQQTFFIYGGYWKAKPESPRGLSNNSLFGRSTNQEMLNGSAAINLKPDDWVFLRPTQSEFVFLQFGDIAVIDNNSVSEYWPIFSNSDAADASATAHS